MILLLRLMKLDQRAKRLGVELIDLETAEVDLSLLTRIPQKLIHRHDLFPVKEEGGVVLVATADPLDIDPLDQVAAALSMPVLPVLATPEAIAKRIKNHLGVGSETIEGLIAARQEEEELELSRRAPSRRRGKSLPKCKKPPSSGW